MCYHHSFWEIQTNDGLVALYKEELKIYVLLYTLQQHTTAISLQLTFFGIKYVWQAISKTHPLIIATPFNNWLNPSMRRGVLSYNPNYNWHEKVIKLCASAFLIGLSPLLQVLLPLRLKPPQVFVFSELSWKPPEYHPPPSHRTPQPQFHTPVRH